MRVIKDNTEKVVLVGGNAIIAPDLPSINDVNFYDYKGTILYSYTKEEFLALTAMPGNPSYDGLTAQGWNWNLTDAKAYVSKYGKLNIGQMYITDDGKTRLYIQIASEGRMDVPLNWSQTVSEGVVIDWGDGSSTQTFSGTGNKSTTHTYSAIGNYIISFEVVNGQLGLGDGANPVIGLNNNANRVYSNMLKIVEIGDGVTSIGSSAFYYCYSLASVTIPEGVTSIGSSAFYACYSLASVAIPDSVTSISSSAFYACYSLASVAIPDGVTSIGGSAFSGCNSLASVTIPEGVTSIGNSAFYACYSLASVAIPDSVTSISSSAFYACYSLASVAIPDSVTSISNSVFNNCYSLASVAIPDSVTSISSNAFGNSPGMKYYYFYPTVPPTLSSTNALSIPTDAIIYVPAGSVDAYKTATNWSNYASHIQAIPSPTPEYIISGTGTSDDPILGWANVAAAVNPNRLEGGSPGTTIDGLYDYLINNVLGSDTSKTVYFSDGVGVHSNVLNRYSGIGNDYIYFGGALMPLITNLSYKMTDTYCFIYSTDFVELQFPGGSGGSIN